MKLWLVKDLWADIYHVEHVVSRKRDPYADLRSVAADRVMC